MTGYTQKKSVSTQCVKYGNALLAAASNHYRPMLNISLRNKARQFGRLVRHSAGTRRTGQVRTPVLVDDKNLAVTFIGHSGFFLQIGGKNVVVDPNFAQWLFILKRLRVPGLRIKDLPPIDYVLVTHAHFDHLHKPSLRAIARMTRRKSGAPPQIIVPRGVHDLIYGLGYREIAELEWWEEYVDQGFSVTHVPARHWGARMLRDYHRVFRRFPRDRQPFAPARSAAPHRRIQACFVPQRPHQS